MNFKEKQTVETTACGLQSTLKNNDASMWTDWNVFSVYYKYTMQLNKQTAF